MSTYEPRRGDLIRATLTVSGDCEGLFAVAAEGDGYGSINLKRLLAAGDVELVARGEPDWRPGDVGQHRETRERFVYSPSEPEDDVPWWSLCEGRMRWVKRAELRGKLVRCTVTPEDES